MAKICWMFGVSHWTIYCRIQSYGLQNTVQFSLLSDAQLDKLVLKQMGRNGFTTGRTYLAGYLKSVGLRVQRWRIRVFGKGGSGKYCLEVGDCCFSEAILGPVAKFSMAFRWAPLPYSLGSCNSWVHRWFF